MPSLEHDLEQGTRDDALRLYGVNSIKMNLRGNVGWPDVLFWIPGGIPLIIEFKLPGEEPDPIQYARHIFLLHQGYALEVHTDKSEALEAIRKAVESAPLPKKSHQVLARSLLRTLVARSRAWQDKRSLRGHKNPPR